MPKRSLIHSMKSPTHHSRRCKRQIPTLTVMLKQAGLLAQVHHPPKSSQSQSSSDRQVKGLPLQWRDRSGIYRIPY